MNESLNMPLNPGFANEFERERCLKYAGRHFDQMLQSLDFTWTLLSHPDPRVRFGALAMLRDYWRPKDAIAEVCERLAVEDSDFDVRCLALNSLISIYYGTKDVRICKWLAEIVFDQGQPVTFRKLAFCMLVGVAEGTPNPLAANFDFPSDVDWAIVEKHRR